MSWWTYPVILIWAIALLAHGLGTLASVRRLKRDRKLSRRRIAAPPGVTVLKPLKGRDPGLGKNLESFFRLDYPKYELVFSVESAGDPSLPLVRRLMARHPGVDARVIVGTRDRSLNPKVRNLARGYQSAKHDLVLISDSNTRVEADFLAAMVAQLTPGVGAVSAVVAGRDPRSFGAFLECMALNTFFARGTIAADELGEACITGKAMMFRRSDAAKFGGLVSLGGYLAEDYMLGKRMEEIGLKVRISGRPIRQVVGRFGFQDFIARQTRWGRIRKAHGKAIFAIEPLLTSMVSGVLGAVALRELTGVTLAQFMAVHLTFWAFCDLMMVRRLQGRLEPAVALAWICREILAVPLWLTIASGNTVNWRGRTLRLRPDGLIDPQVVAARQPVRIGNDEAPVSVGSRYQ